MNAAGTKDAPKSGSTRSDKIEVDRNQNKPDRNRSTDDVVKTAVRPRPRPV